MGNKRLNTLKQVCIDLKSITGTPFKRKPGYCLLPYIKPGWVLSTMNISFAYQNLRLIDKKANEVRNQLRLDTTRNFSRNSSFIPSPWSVVLILYSVRVLYLICFLLHRLSQGLVRLSGKKLPRPQSPPFDYFGKRRGEGSLFAPSFLNN